MSTDSHPSDSSTDSIEETPDGTARADTVGSSGPDADRPAASLPVRARTVLGIRAIWIFPVAIPLVLVVVMTFIYVGSILNPTAHLHGLPVMVVNQDSGALVNGEHVNEGASVVHTLTSAEGVATRLGLQPTTLSAAKDAMDHGNAYATVVIPPTFTASLLAAAGEGPPPAATAAQTPTVQLLENVRLGSLGVNLASGVLTPAFQQISAHIGQELVARSTAVARALRSPCPSCRIRFVSRP